MKKLLFISLVFVVLSCQEKEANPPPIVGTWEYTGSLQGRAIFTETHFIWIYKSPEDTLFTLAGAGTHSYSPSDSLFTWNTTYSTIPGMAGTWHHGGRFHLITRRPLLSVHVR